MENISKNIKQANKATQVVFLIIGLGLSSWVPMVPLAKDRLGLNEADLGLLLLMLGLGAMIMMPISGILINRFGSRKISLLGIVIFSLMLPVLLIIDSNIGMGLALFIFGAGIGMVDVAGNAHGIQVQKMCGKPIMSAVHGLYSLGGLIGALGMGYLIRTGFNPIVLALIVAFLLIILTLSQYKFLFSKSYENELSEVSKKKIINTKPDRFQWIHKSILIWGLMCFLIYLSEGAMIDWSAVFLRDLKNVTPEFTGSGFAAFSIAMATMRLTGDKMIMKLNSKVVVIGGILIAALGVLISVYASSIPIVLFGFALLGIGAANLIPIFLTEGGNIEGVNPSVAVPAITTMAYAGQLTGPALLGFVAHHSSLQTAFILISVFFIVVAIIYLFIKKQN